MPGDLEDELDRLYGVDLADFVAERTRLAGALRKEGRQAEAARVQELRKPSLAVWTVNQLARRRREGVDLLLDAGHRLAVAQRALLTGGDQKAFERARKDEQAALKRLVQAARSMLAERASTAMLERVTSTLRAAAVSDAARPDLARGRLTQEVASTGFEAFTGVPISTARPRKQSVPSQQRGATNSLDRQEAVRQAVPKRDAITLARADLKAARERETSVAKRLREAERAEREARERWKRAEQTAEGLRAGHQAAASAVEEARAKLEEARRPSEGASDQP
jgi:hypothetical protein